MGNGLEKEGQNGGQRAGKWGVRVVCKMEMEMGGAKVGVRGEDN